MYHQVTPRPLASYRKYTVTPRAFAAQMRWLALAGYVPINLDALLDYRRGRGRLPSRPVVITFDDGYQDCIDYAVPILRARAFTAVFYLVTGLMEETSRWLLPERGIELPLIDWPTARWLEAAGFQCGSHSMSHPRLANMEPAACRSELLESRRLLEDRLGHKIRHLAYPYGSFDERVRTLVGEVGYHSACSVRIGLSPPDDDPLALHRVPINGQDSLLDFACRLRTARTVGESLRGEVKGIWRRLRPKGMSPGRWRDRSA